MPVTIVMGSQIPRLKELVPQSTLWLGYGDPVPDVTYIVEPQYEAVAAYAQRCRSPRLPINHLYIGNLDSFRHGVSARRNPSPCDFNGAEQLMELSKRATQGDIPWEAVCIQGGSRLYEMMMVRVGRGLSQFPEKIIEWGRALVAECLSRLVCDFRDAGLHVYITAALIQVGNSMVPQLPGSVLELSNGNILGDGNGR